MRRGGSWPGRTPVLLDDIASSGQTLVAALQVLGQSGLPRPLCIVVHALFAPVAHPTNAIAVAPLLGPAVLAIARLPDSPQWRSPNS